MAIDLIPLVELFIIISDIVFLLVLLYTEKKNPSKIVVWALVFLILPFVGFILYIFIGQTVYSDHAFRIKSLNDEKTKELVEYDKGVADKEEIPEYRQLARTMQNFGSIGYTTNNTVRLFTLGDDKFDALYSDLRAAKRYIYLEYYIIRNDELGNELMNILTEKVKEGVEVKLLTDYFGWGKGPQKSIKAFKAAGGQFALFHSVVALALSPKKNNRNHRKLAVIDGEIGYCGGFNIGDEYLGKGPLGFWRDTAVRIVGPAVPAIHLRFEMDWEYAHGTPAQNLADLYKDVKFDTSGDAKTIVVSGGPDVAEFNPVRMQYLTMINNAKKSVYIHSPYFIPDNSLKDALSLAAARGVDVKVIIPDKPDHLFVFWNNISSAYDVMRNGVKVYMYNRGFVHSKTMVVDGEYCSIGSANFDDRSLVLNFETNLLVMSKQLGEEMNAAYEEDLKYCTEYTTEKFEHLTFFQSIRLVISRLFVNLT